MTPVTAPLLSPLLPIRRALTTLVRLVRRLLATENTDPQAEVRAQLHQEVETAAALLAAVLHEVDAEKWLLDTFIWGTALGSATLGDFQIVAARRGKKGPVRYYAYMQGALCGPPLDSLDMALVAALAYKYAGDAPDREAQSRQTAQHVARLLAMPERPAE